MSVEINSATSKKQRPKILTLVPGFSFSFGKTPLFQLPTARAAIVVRGGDICAIFGPNGCGKTTLLNVLSGLIRPTTGRLCFGSNTDPHALVIRSSTPISLYIGAKVAQWNGGIRRTFQVPVVSAEISGAEHVSVARRIERQETYASWFAAPLRRLFPGKNRQDKADKEATYNESVQTLVALDLPRSIPDPSTLSYGQKRLLNISQALFGGKRLLILDEPFANLSNSAIETVKQILRDFVASQERAVILVEHRAKNLPDFATCIITIRNGILRFDQLKGTTEEQESFLSRLGSAYYDG